jgi:hypothetical protein
MMKRLCVLAFLVAPMLLSVPVLSAGTLDEKIDKALVFSQIQLDRLAQKKGPRRFVAYTDTIGKWVGRGLNGWCCGFTPGLMWMMYDHTGEEKWANYGREWTDAVRARATAADNDTGFQIFNAYGYGLRYASQPADASLLSMNDIRDWPAFLSALSASGKSAQPSPSKRIWELLPKDIRSAAGKSVVGNEQKSNIIKALNSSILSNRDFYKEAYFPNIRLPRGIRGFLSDQENLSSSDAQKLNRALIEAAYPNKVAGIHTLSAAEMRDYEGVVRWANETFTSQRYNAIVGAYRTWPPQLVDPYKGQFEVNSDMMMNLELPVYVAMTTKNYDLLDKVMRHQETTWQHTIFKTGDKQWTPPTSPEYVKRKHGSHGYTYCLRNFTFSIIDTFPNESFRRPIYRNQFF